MKFDNTTTPFNSEDTTAISEVAIVKKSYSRPVLTKFGKVAKLTAALTGSDTDTLGGNEIG